MTRAAVGFAAALALSLFARPAAAEQESGHAAVRYADGTVDSIETRDWDGVPYLSALEISRLFAGVKRWRPELLEMTIVSPGAEVRLVLGNPVAVVNDESVVMPGPVRSLDGVLWVPLELVTRRLAPLSQGRVAWAPERGEFLLGGDPSTIRMVRASKVGVGGAVRIDVETSRVLAHELVAPDERTVILRLFGGVFPGDSLGLADSAGVITSFTAAEGTSRATLTLRLSRPFSTSSSTADGNPPRVSVHLSDDAPADIPPPELLGEIGDSGEATPVEPLAPRVRTVVIDPGHGGDDAGCAGPSGLTEKEVTLAVGQALETILTREMGVAVILTRAGDDPVPLDRRPEIANGAGADLFLSIHCDAWTDSTARGAAVEYHAGEGPAAGASDREGPPPGVPGEGEIRFVPWRAAQGPFRDVSAVCAELIAGEIARGEGGSSRGARPASVAVLRSAAMPAVSVSLGFLTNAKDEEALRSEDGRERIARAIARGIAEFATYRQDGRLPAWMDGPSGGASGALRSSAERRWEAVR